MARMKFSELAKQTMTPESIARARKAAMKEIAAMELAELRDALQVTQADLAERMKVSQVAISKLEKRNRNIHGRSASIHHLRNGREPDHHRGLR
ncbi:MAG TPA: helix-turn-helix transcriptional regulator [Terriglobales bacterium]|jgi:DNA-binding transcriptional regulator YiaG|nr:helix-turn-helix transcriptional regulator [Terriglobales bacterium]